uniref:Uncharacterized protein n=1 Tax=Anguilla anguilla TaxID=7936 RepID=A0A0E9XQP7_ANGAN
MSKVCFYGRQSNCCFSCFKKKSSWNTIAPCNFTMSNPNALDRQRQERFSTQESEIQARTVAIYGSQSIPSPLPDVRKAWVEDALNVRTACQC